MDFNQQQASRAQKLHDELNELLHQHVGPGFNDEKTECIRHLTDAWAHLLFFAATGGEAHELNLYDAMRGALDHFKTVIREEDATKEIEPYDQDPLGSDLP